MKHILALIAMVLSLNTLAPKKAEAGVGGVMALFGAGAGIPVMIVGGAAIGTSALIFASSKGCEGWECVPITSAGIGALLLGIVLLDDEQNALAFTAVDSTTGEELGMTEAERVAYNSELDEINAIRTQIGADLIVSGAPSIEKSNALWSNYSREISSEAFAGVKKISQAFVNNNINHD